MDTPLAVNPGAPFSIPGSTSVSDETKSRDPVSWDVLNTQPLPVNIQLLKDNVCNIMSRNLHTVTDQIEYYSFLSHDVESVSDITPFILAVDSMHIKCE